MVKKKMGRPAYLLKLQCAKCEKIFKSQRFRKYCSQSCQLAANKVKAGYRYQQLRKALLREQGKLIN